MVTLGHAVSGTAKGKTTKGDRAGNQGNELRFQNWYLRDKGWSHVLRCKDKAARHLIADAMEAAVRNRHIGYDQNQRTTLYDAVAMFDFDIGCLTKDVETDCSALVSVCCNYAGIPIPRDMYTGNELQKLTATKMFKIYTANEYIKHPDKLMRGDILLGPGHTAVVVNVRYAMHRDLFYKRVGTRIKGDDVKALQSRLNAKGFSCGEVDGVFGIKTSNALTDYQSELVRSGVLASARYGIMDSPTAHALGFIYY